MPKPDGAAVSIRLDGVGFDILGRRAISELSWRGEARRIGVVGRNGSGKSTLARLLAGLLAPTRGEIRIEGVDLFREREEALRLVGVLFQNPEHQIIFPSVAEEIAFGLRQKGLSKAEAAERTLETLARFGKAHWKEAPVQALSQGQKHLLCMMAVLAMGPRLLILDEPFAGLDFPTKRQLTRHLEASGAALLHISHDVADLAGYEEILWIDKGSLLASGPPERVLRDYAAEMVRQGERDDLSDLAG